MMNHPKHALLSFLFLVFSTLSTAQERPESPISSPYFIIQGNQAALDDLPVKSIEADVYIAGVIANVELEQTYINLGEQPLEAIYVFPTSTNAAIYDMVMTIGNRKISAKIDKKNKARATYEEARESGKRAALIEQSKTNVFQMNVSNIQPGDTIKVALKYTEFLNPTEGKYEFVLPTTVGPRYDASKGMFVSQQNQWVDNPYMNEGEDSPYTFDIHVHLNAGIPVQNIRSNSHLINVDFASSTICEVYLDPSEGRKVNEDFVLEYYLKGNAVETGLLVHESEQEKFFALMVQPPKDIAPEMVVPRQYSFVIDISGSMKGFPLDVSKELITELLEDLSPGDLFNVILFSDHNKKLFDDPLPATDENIDMVLKKIRRVSGGGGTRLYNALDLALGDDVSPSYSHSIIVMSDGYVDDERDVFRLIDQNLGTANMFAFGIGSAVNRYLIEGMAFVGKGEPFIVTDRNIASQKASQFTSYIKKPVLTNIKVDFGDNQVHDVTPSQIPDVFADRSILVYGKYSGSLDYPITISAQAGQDVFSASLVMTGEASTFTSPLPYLWARNKIKELEDYNFNFRPQKEAVTEIGLKYSLVTPYTSFVAVDNSEEFRSESVAMVQPLPLPAGMSDLSNAQPGSWPNKMAATGAVSRAVGSSGIRVLVPSETIEIQNPFIALRWTSEVSSSGYVITIEDIFDNVIHQQETIEPYFWLDTRAIAPNPTGLYLIRIESTDNEDITSERIGIKLSETELVDMLDTSIKQPVDYYISMAEQYYEAGFFCDAITAMEMGMYYYGEDEDMLARYGGLYVALNLIKQ